MNMCSTSNTSLTFLFSQRFLNVFLTFLLLPLQCSDAYAIKALIEHLKAPLTFVALLGPGCSIATEPVASVVHFWNLIQVTFAEIIIEKIPTIEAFLRRVAFVSWGFVAWPKSETPNEKLVTYIYVSRHEINFFKTLRKFSHNDASKFSSCDKSLKNKSGLNQIQFKPMTQTLQNQ